MARFDADWVEVARLTGLPKAASQSGARPQLWSTERPTYTPQIAATVRAAYSVDFETIGFEDTLPAT